MSDLFSLPFAEDRFGCSREGAEIALPKAGTQLGVVYQLLIVAGPLTDRQIAERTGYAISVVCARRNALVKDGLVEAVDTVPGGKGVSNTRWAVVR